MKSTNEIISRFISIIQNKFGSTKNLVLVLITTFGIVSLLFTNCARHSSQSMSSSDATNQLASNPDNQQQTNGQTQFPKPQCTFNGVSYEEGQSVLAFQNSTVPFGQPCLRESRICQNGAWSGSYNFANCAEGAAASCLFNGTTLQHGDEVSAYANSSVPANASCMEEKRKCNNGVLSGSYAFARCSEAAPASCLFDGKTVSHTGTVTAYQASSVPFGSMCLSQTRTCTDGVLSGSFTFANCAEGVASSCLFNGATVAHNQEVKAFQTSTVPFNGTCVSQMRKCTNGVLDGSYQFASCNEGAPASCLFSGATVAHSQDVTAFQSASVAYNLNCLSEKRKCDNGTLSGTFAFPACSPATARNCTFSGSTVSHTSEVTAYQTSSVPFGSQCVSEQRKCTDGTLSGSYTFKNCAPQAAASCTLDGVTIAHSVSMTAYNQKTVAWSTTNNCLSTTRTCNNGTLNGLSTYVYSSCTMAAPANCTWNGATVLHGKTVQAYPYATVGYGSTCGSTVPLTCTNGSFGGATYYPTCTCQTGFTMVNGTCGCATGKVYDTVTKTCKTQAYRWKLISESDAMYSLKYTCGGQTITYTPFTNPNLYIVTTTAWPDPETLRDSATAAANSYFSLVRQNQCGAPYNMTDIGGCVSQFQNCPTRKYQREAYLQ